MVRAELVKVVWGGVWIMGLWLWGGVGVIFYMLVVTLQDIRGVV
jgi:hypothetical protein